MRKIYIKSKLKKNALFLDRDGVINKDAPGKYIKSLKDIKIYPSAIKGLRKIDSKKYHLIIITNQSAVGRGYIDIEMAFKINDFIVNELKRNNIMINALYFCPHAPWDKCDCRKPKTGLIKEALQDFDIIIKDSFLVGDKKSDMEMAKKAGIKSIFVLTGQAKNQLKKYEIINSDYKLKDLRAINKIL
jgi:D-glycero-D-manno-heptose 1,7-bisphosphate phosphatase